MCVDSDTLYITDNGATLCGAHLGMTARLTGCDLSGQPILAVTPYLAALSAGQGAPIACETCGKRAQLSYTLPEPCGV